ncbi:MAG: OmpA family protein [Clostridia bacterium]|nr:OmpA family protein [Clostridia bacterium]
MVDTQPEENYSLSISDLMAGLLSIFILTLVYYMLNFSQATAQLTQSDAIRADMLESLERELKNRGIEVRVDAQHGVLRLPEGILFDLGKADLRESGLKVIRVLGPVLYEVLNRKEYKQQVETVFIEGHTDNLPVHSGRFPSNWELSAQRAINTWNSLLGTEPRLASLRNSRGEPLFSCSGYADTRPIRPNDTPEGRQENRRIDLRFSLAPPRRGQGSEKALGQVLMRGYTQGQVKD